MLRHKGENVASYRASTRTESEKQTENGVQVYLSHTRTNQSVNWNNPKRRTLCPHMSRPGAGSPRPRCLAGLPLRRQIWLCSSEQQVRRKENRHRLYRPRHVTHEVSPPRSRPCHKNHRGRGVKGLCALESVPSLRIWMHGHTSYLLSISYAMGGGSPTTFSLVTFDP